MLLRNIRFYVLVFSVLLSGVIFFQTVSTSEGPLVVFRLNRYYALIAVSYLYLTLLIGPAVHVFSWIPYKSKLIHARRAIGVSAFYFAVLHSSTAFFWQLGGFSGLFYLEGKYLFAISLSFTAEVILALMAATSFDYMVKGLGYPRWKFLHRFVYLAAFFIVVHAFLLGTDFADLFSPVSIIALTFLAFLLVVEAIAWVKYLRLRRAVFKKK